MKFKIKCEVYCKGPNHHGPNSETVRGWAIKRIPGMGDGYFRLMLYAPSGKCWNLDIYKPLPNPEWSI